jgi:hypothetical protein
MFAGESGHASCCPAAAPPFTVPTKISFSVYPLKRKYKVKRLEEAQKSFRKLENFAQKESCNDITL